MIEDQHHPFSEKHDNSALLLDLEAIVIPSLKEVPLVSWGPEMGT